MTAYAVIGLGELGHCLALNLARAGMDVATFDLNPDCATPEGCARHNALVDAAKGRHLLTCLPNPAASEAVLREALPHIEGDWIECSTLGRDDILRLSALAAEHGVETLECPVTGGVHLARRGEITVLAGGDAALIERHRPALRAIGNRLFHMGPIGSAALIKVITNMLAFVHLKADAEALMLAKRGGLDLATAWAAIKESSGTSFVHETEGQLILSGSYDVGFDMALALKDLGFAEAFGAEYGVPLELAAATKRTYERAAQVYGLRAQSPMIAKLLEDALGTDLRAEGFPQRLE